MKTGLEKIGIPQNDERKFFVSLGKELNNMDIYIHIKGNDVLRLSWECPFLPRIGEHFYIHDFLTDANVLEDTLIIQDIQWHIVNKDICASLFLGYDQIETDVDRGSSIELN